MLATFPGQILLGKQEFLPFQITDFCETFYNGVEWEHLHDSELPNKHNALCDGMSAWSIISASEDIDEGGTIADPGKPRFDILRPDENVGEFLVRCGLTVAIPFLLPLRWRAALE